ncbi:bifunctional 2-polyprenyl-6-hydroxyphenol methylase/3-demethylubiquinol 3-O-methyltransferase UbiG [Mangrovimonas sp. TPBH4]|uniref:class I SAM-dependent methyltransferase n=1 Tax=Mangrovimonas sp. TPBH4 TaxID=1645914 RepID=UPI0006B45401|nr:class I SAM-dependent methyltransferase [Mangrovimonas sp. TPBH4]
MIKDTTQWYKSWFDTPFYHILYKDRNQHEAQRFMDNLSKYLNLTPDSKILDLACGRGRHSKYLNSLGYDVTGVDLSENSIAHAKQFETEKLHFKVHDMCSPCEEEFDAVLNLFTSFGYFDNDENNLATIKAIKHNLNTYGLGVIDFMNKDFVVSNLVPEETKTMEGIDFHLKRYLKDGYVFKDISFSYEGQEYKFQERVKALSLEDFESLFEKADVYLLDVFGDYNLRKFYKASSERLIMIFK